MTHAACSLALVVSVSVSEADAATFQAIVPRHVVVPATVLPARVQPVEDVVTVALPSLPNTTSSRSPAAWVGRVMLCEVPLTVVAPVVRERTVG